jgi:DNA mismatch repair protein MutS
MAGAVRFTAEELIEIESRIVTAAEQALAIEQEVFAELSAAIAAQEQQLGELAGALAELDCEAGLAQLAAEQGYTRPMLDDSSAFEIRGGRHPVVEQALRAATVGAFIENDCVLVTPRADMPAGFDEVTEARVWLVTGPNMAGKSTFLRQNALIAVLAQMGSFVPARSAHIGVIDRLFCASVPPTIWRGRSTFMVEMVRRRSSIRPPSAACHPRRDRPRYRHLDGLSIAWAVRIPARSAAAVRCFTHYHELTVLAGRLADIANELWMCASGRRDRLPAQGQAGAADRSYGIQVAKLAGLRRR